MTPIDNLRSENSKTRDQTVDAVLRNRKSVIEQLIPLIDPANAKNYSDETRSVAAYLLGELRATEAVPVLSRALADPPGRNIFPDISRYDTPVFHALVKIGRPAVPALIEHVKTSDNETLRKNTLDVLYHVLGGKRRLLELLVKLSELETDKESPDHKAARRFREAHSWAESHFKYTRGTREPLY